MVDGRAIVNAEEVEELVAKHLGETRARAVDCTPQELSRGESTLRDYFIMKIDIVDSTLTFWPRSPATYVRFAHAYLSTIDRITQHFGAHRNQTEYHGDSVLAFFPSYGNTPEGVLTAAVYSHFAVRILRASPEFRDIALNTKTLVHFAKLSVASIGPYGESHLVVLGMPIHLVAKKEKLVDAGKIWVSDEFAQQMQSTNVTAFLEQQFKTVITQKPLPAYKPEDYLGALGKPTPFSFDTGLLASLGDIAKPPPPYSLGGLASLADLLSPKPAPTSAKSLFNMAYPSLLDPPMQTEEKKVSDGYHAKIAAAYKALGIPL